MRRRVGRSAVARVSIVITQIGQLVTLIGIAVTATRGSIALVCGVVTLRGGVVAFVRGIVSVVPPGSRVPIATPFAGHSTPRHLMSPLARARNFTVAAVVAAWSSLDVIRGLGSCGRSPLLAVTQQVLDDRWARSRPGEDLDSLDRRRHAVLERLGERDGDDAGPAALRGPPSPHAVLPMIGDIALVINPVAGRGRGLRMGRAAAEHLRSRGSSVRELVAPGPGAASEFILQAVADGCGALVVCGGDGLVHLALQGLALTEVPLGVIPAGSGNDFARAVGLPLGDPAATASVVAAGRTVRSTSAAAATAGSAPCWPPGSTRG